MSLFQLSLKLHLYITPGRRRHRDFLQRRLLAHQRAQVVHRSREADRRYGCSVDQHEFHSTILAEEMGINVMEPVEAHRFEQEKAKQAES